MIKPEKPDQPHPERLLQSGDVRALLGGVSEMSVWRWTNDDRLGFPQPIKISSRNYWRERELLEWIEAQRETA